MKEVHAFVEFTEYFRRFIKDYARIARPLNDLLIEHSTAKKEKAKRSKTKTVPFEWTDNKQKVFKSLKEKLTNPKVLAYADYRNQFKLHTDASSTGLGAVLYQNQNGQDKVVAYASRSLRPSGKKLSGPQVGVLGI